jgi:hypothetical protein
MVEHQVEVAVIMVEEELLRAIVVAVQAAAVRLGQEPFPIHISRQELEMAMAR